jgi:hypothetical protein
MAQQDKMARDHRRGRQDVMNAVTRQDVGPLRFGGEAWLRNLQMRRSKINYENRSFEDFRRDSKIGVLWTVTVIPVLRQDLRPLRFGGEAWFRSLQLRRSKINHEHKSFVDCHRNSKVGRLG